MKRLLVLRHAKSSWAQPGISDIERPLNERGHKQLLKLSTWFTSQSIVVEKIVCSSSNRTLETYERLKPALGDADFEPVSALYNGTLDLYLDILKIQTAKTVLLIGHNPTCDEISRYLTAPSSPQAERLMSHHFGTACLAIFEFPQNDWQQIGQASCQLIEFVRPKEIGSFS